MHHIFIHSSIDEHLLQVPAKEMSLVTLGMSKVGCFLLMTSSAAEMFHLSGLALNRLIRVTY